MQNEGARIQNRLELVYYRFVRFTSSRILDEQKHKNGRALFSRRGEIRLGSQGTIKTAFFVFLKMTNIANFGWKTSLNGQDQGLYSSQSRGPFNTKLRYCHEHIFEISPKTAVPRVTWFAL